MVWILMLCFNDPTANVERCARYWNTYQTRAQCVGSGASHANANSNEFKHFKCKRGVRQKEGYEGEGK